MKAWRPPAPGRRLPGAAAGAAGARPPRGAGAVCGAKKKGKGGKGKKGGGNKKGGSKLDALLQEKAAAEAAPAAAEDGWPPGAPQVAGDQHRSVETVMWLLLVVESYARAVGRPLPLGGSFSIAEIADKVWEAPFVLLTHRYGEEEEEGVEGGEDGPKFNYANAAALTLFEGNWDDLIGLPSSQSAEDAAEVQADRDRLLAQSREAGFIEGYEGWRVSRAGTRYLVKNATIWEVKSPNDESLGQAAVFTEWELEDGTACSTLTAQDEGADGGPRPDAVTLEEAEAAVAEQGAVVRDLKAQDGMTNASPEVQAAVAVLLERKAVLEGLQAAAGAE